MIQFKHLESSKIVRIGEFSAHTIGIVVHGTQSPIRKLLEEGEQGNVLLIAKVQEIASAYGAREGLNDNVLGECLRIAKDKFSMLGLGELGEAFRMAASGELKGIKVAVYGGIWNASIFGSVLGAYREFRRKVLTVMVKSEENMAKAARAERLKAKEANLELHRNFHAMVLEKGSKYQSWREVPAFWYGIAMKLELITFEKGEAQKIYAWSIETARVELVRQLQAATSQGQKISFQGVLDAFEQGNMTHAKVISRKVSVWVKLLGNDFNQVINQE